MGGFFVGNGGVRSETPPDAVYLGEELLRRASGRRSHGSRRLHTFRRSSQTGTYSNL